MVAFLERSEYMIGFRFLVKAQLPHIDLHIGSHSLGLCP
jgi:hypothetical protein